MGSYFFTDRQAEEGTRQFNLFLKAHGYFLLEDDYFGQNSTSAPQTPQFESWKKTLSWRIIMTTVKCHTQAVIATSIVSKYTKSSLKLSEKICLIDFCLNSSIFLWTFELQLISKL